MFWSTTPSSPVVQMASYIASWVLSATPSDTAVRYMRWNIGQFSAAFHDAGR